MEEKVVLVDKNDKEIGIEEKIKTHREGKLHRSFSIFVLNSKGELLLQKRAKAKYHSGELWANTCCSHPRPGEPIEAAMHRRLKEEMGFDCELKKIFDFIYKIKFDDTLYENEFNNVFVGEVDGELAMSPNPREVDDWKWIGLEELEKDIEKNPDDYAYWLRISIDRVISYTKK